MLESRLSFSHLTASPIFLSIVFSIDCVETNLSSQSFWLTTNCLT
ncbi:hypothetical protein RMSM_06086 [Rhodopirellula maiorica SM1]|uniref:Uncharacterized protein n=1 Tax=Rhodopirellula maiorica SM1 TaxID=1265738 RepID=M5RC87_9BACT|nr:hypothetical protein RMSM_06086 [Rhodopirellula maiorica SM1]